MALPGETIASGASDRCPVCKEKLPLRIMRSGAGYYIGTGCCVGPYSRESGYYGSQELAERMLEAGTFGR